MYWLGLKVYLDVFAVVAARRQLDAPEGHRAFEGDFNGRLLHAVFPVQGGVACGRSDTAEVPLD